MHVIMAYTFTGRELHLIKKALRTHITKYEREQEGKKVKPHYAKEYEDMKKLYETF